MSSRPEVSISPFRAKVAHASEPVLQRLSRIPVVAVIVVVLVLVIGGAILGGILGAALLLLVAAFAGWLAYLSWPRLETPERMMRLAPIVLLVAVAIVAGASHAILF